MNVSYRWLQELIPGLDAPAEEVAARLDGLGIAVDELRALGADLGDIVIGRVEKVGRHPDADRLSLCEVDAGTGELVSVVCGAPNVRAGAYYPFAPVGASLPGGVKIRKAKIRGQQSQGMLCSERELGLGRDQAGIMELAGEFRPGDRFVSAVGLDDVRFTLDITPNRPDLLSHYGVAREVAPHGVAGIRLPERATTPSAQAAGQVQLASGGAAAEGGGIRITIDDAGGCPRYIGIVIRGVHIAPSPSWLASRLRAAGMRPINNVVDATNYVLAELGQPLHAFDLHKLAGGEIRVRRSRAGESIVTLDGETRKLPEGSLVIADAKDPVAVAGVMGGADSEVGEGTEDILLECALFDPSSVRMTRGALGLSTEASQRFERGVDPERVERAARRAAALIVELAGGEAAGGADARASVWEPRDVELRPARAQALLGIPFSGERCRELLEEIGFVAQGPADGGRIAFRVPGYRSYDVVREVDLIEEVARRHGYEEFPDELRPYRPGTVPDDALAVLEARLRDLLVARGFLEARGLPFTSPQHGEVKLLLPLSATEDHLRAALVPGLLRRVEHNFARGAADIRLFEIGTVFGAAEPGALPLEATRLGLVFTGARSAPHWSEPAQPFDLWDLKGLLVELADALSASRPTPVEAEAPAWADTPAFRLAGAGERATGWGAQVAARAIDAPAWAGTVWAAELELTPPERGSRVQFRSLPAFPAIERDVALVVPNAIRATQIEDTVRRSAAPLLESLSLFDVYRGEGLEVGSRSLAFRLKFRAPDRTLTDAEADRAMEHVLEALEELDVRRR